MQIAGPRLVANHSSGDETRPPEAPKQRLGDLRSWHVSQIKAAVLPGRFRTGSFPGLAYSSRWSRHITSWASMRIVHEGVMPLVPSQTRVRLAPAPSQRLEAAQAVLMTTDW